MADIQSMLCDHVPDEPPRLTSYSLISGPLDVDWTRVFLDAVGREADVEVPPACHEARRATAACPPWQETVLETLPNFIELIHRSAAGEELHVRIRGYDEVYGDENAKIELLDEIKKLDYREAFGTPPDAV